MHPHEYKRLAPPLEAGELDHLLKLDDVWAILEISRSSGYNLIRAGRLPVLKIFKSCRVRASDLRRLMATGTSSEES